ncbi:hypothetical protein FJTKL_07653 [Diaporthe vaccinii]|uniref:Uncharacterized protein n=1 Tax=Diaporthe vaccinii TaxID=105482 RepID=A0ABR4ET62_9PEZI
MSPDDLFPDQVLKNAAAIYRCRNNTQDGVGAQRVLLLTPWPNVVPQYKVKPDRHDGAVQHDEAPEYSYAHFLVAQGVVERGRK